MQDTRTTHFTQYLIEKADQGYRGTTFLSGLEKFDNKLKGIKTRELITITGKTGEGKTLFAESWCNRIMESNEKAKVCLFSYEVPAEEMLAKYVHDTDKPIYVPMQLECMDTEWLYKTCKHAKETHGCNIFMFDHLHFLVDMNTKLNMSLNIGGFMRGLKMDIATQLDVGVILIAHQRGVPKGEDPSLEGIRDSALVAAESDSVIVVWRRKNFDQEALDKIENESPILAERIRQRTLEKPEEGDSYSHNFAVVQIAKSRRTGTYRWSKLFQKVGYYLEEV